MITEIIKKKSKATTTMSQHAKLYKILLTTSLNFTSKVIRGETQTVCVTIKQLKVKEPMKAPELPPSIKTPVESYYIQLLPPYML